MLLVRTTRRLLVFVAMTVAATGSPPLRADDKAAVADDTSLRQLLDALRAGESFRVRATAAVALGRSGDPRAVAPLTEALRGDGSYAVRAAACAALGRIQNPTALPALVESLADSDEYVRAAADEALARFYTPALLFSFRELLHAPDERARRAAVDAYATVMRASEASAGVAAFVVAALADESEPVVVAAESGLEALPHDRLVPLLLEGLRSGDSGVQAGCARLLSRRVDARAVEPLQTLVIDSGGTPDVRAAALEALRKHVEHLDVAALAADATNVTAPGRLRSLRVLAAVRDPRAAALVERALTDGDPAVRVAGARAAADFGGPKARALLESATAREADARQKRQLELLLKSMPR